MTQQIDDIIARFGREGWLVQKTKDNFWALQPKGVFDYKVFLLTYNPFTDKYQIVKSLTPNDPHHAKAVKILEESDRLPGKKRDRPHSCLSEVSYDLSIIKVPSMFPIKISPTKWINLAEIREVTINEDNSLFVIWNTGEYSNFMPKDAPVILKALEEAQEAALSRLRSA